MTHFIDAFRLLTGRAPKSLEATLSPRAILAIFLGLGLLDAAVQRLAAGHEAEFSLYGVTPLIAGLAIGLAVVALFSRREAAGAQLRLFVLLLAGATTVSLAAIAGGEALGGLGFFKAKATIVLGAAVLSTLAYLLGGRQIFRFAGSRRPTWASAGFTACLCIATFALPNWPVFLGSDFDPHRANFWEALAHAARKEPSRAETAEAKERQRAALSQLSAVEAAQPYLLDAELSRLTPRAPRKPNLFVVGVAGWSHQKVFLKETEASLDIIQRRLHAEGKTVALVNNAATEKTRPIANIQNLSHVLRGVAAKMNSEEDILLLTMTSHGSQEGFALEYGALVERTLQPKALKTMLDASGVKNRIVIVSACHSGVFASALADARTLVITAARAERSSFGCADDRNWTYFGDAFFAHGLNEEPSLTEAFVRARNLVALWEAEHKIEASEPQIAGGEELRRRFPGLVGPAEALAASELLRETRKETIAAGTKPL